MVIKIDKPHAIAGDPTHRPAPIPGPDSSRSFWHSEPSEFLLGHRTTSHLPAYADVVVVGSGITGASAARYLAEKTHGAKAGWNIVMLEAREACWGATGRNGGHLQPLLYNREPEIGKFELKNCQEVASYIASNDVDCEFRALSGCRSFWTEPLLSEALSAVEKLKREAPSIGARVSTVNSPALLAQHRLASPCPGATITVGAASLWPYKYVASILESLIRSERLNLQTHTAVTRIVPSPNPSPSGWTLHTTRGKFQTRHVILATNAWTSHLLPGFADILVPVRGTMSALLPPVGSPPLPDSHGFIGAGPGCNPEADDYLIQRPVAGGHLMFGGGRTAGSLPSVGETDDAVVDEAELTYLRTMLPRLLNLGGEADAQTELRAEAAWSGIMCYSRDNTPWVGAVPGQTGLWLCAGYTGHGMPNATLCAKAVVAMLLGEDEGRDAGDVARDLVRAGELPRCYLVSDQRLRAARELPSVKQQDEMGIAAYSDGTEALQEKL